MQFKFQERGLPGPTGMSPGDGGRDVPSLEDAFAAFRANTIGYQQTFISPFGTKEILYADWTASGRAYRPIEEFLQETIMPFLGNTHTEATITGTRMSKAYEQAKCIIKEHVHANGDDVLIFCGSGTTAAVNKLQRILGMRLPGQFRSLAGKEGKPNADPGVDECFAGILSPGEDLRPVVFVTHMEHHSNHISWLETIATVEIIPAAANGNVDLDAFGLLLEKFRHRKTKIAAITACSNVTGIQTPYFTIAKMIHGYDGLCFVDFACSAPYVNIDMHPPGTGSELDAIYFSPHKFLGGPGTPGILIFNKKIYHNRVPDQPGGGTILYSNPWGGYEYIPGIEQREDGGTPPILQGIKAAMCIRLKEQMGTDNILGRETEMLALVFTRFAAIGNARVLEGENQKRLGVISFIVEGGHYNLVVKLLNDRFGIQARGGCSCAGTYGHHLLQVDKKMSGSIRRSILTGDLSAKPGWVRISLHPTMTNAEIDFLMDAIELSVEHLQEWAADYSYDPETNGYFFKGARGEEGESVSKWFEPGAWD